MKALSSIFIATLFFASFGSFSQSAADVSGQSLDPDEAYTALVTNCFVCHNPRIKNADDLVAPPMVSVKYLYKLRYPEMQTFVSYVSDFVLDPNNQKAVMQGPVMTHGVMPNLSFDADQVRMIAKYIYENEIEVPVWYPDYFQKIYGEVWTTQ
jgi:mono/diheme cytochrome c family protein